MITTTRFQRIEFSLIHLDIWRRAHAIRQIFFVRYTHTEAIVTHYAAA